MKRIQPYLPQVAVVTVILIGVGLWCRHVFPLLASGQYDKAGQIGDAFGFFNALGLIILSFTLLLQIAEFRASRQEQQAETATNRALFFAQIDYNFNSRLHQENIAFVQKHCDLYLKYYTMFEEGASAYRNGRAVTTLSPEQVVKTVKRIFHRAFENFRATFRETYNSEIEVFHFPEQGAGSDIFDYGIKVFDLVETHLNRIDKSTTEVYFAYLATLKGRLSPHDQNGA